MTVPYSWQVYVRLRWQDGSIPTNQQISQIRAYETYGDTKQDLCAAGLEANGMCTLYFGREKFYPPRTNPTLTIEVFDTSGVLIYTSQEFANVINLSTLDVVITQSVPQPWRVYGAVTDENGPVTSGTVRVFDIYHEPDRELGIYTLNSGNTYDVTYTDSSFEKSATHLAPNLEVRYFNPLATLLGTSGNSAPSHDQLLNISFSNPNVIWHITGTVLKSCGLPLSGGLIKAVDTHNGINTIMIQTGTDATGHFNFTFTKESFQVGGATHTAPDLQIWVYDQAVTALLGKSGVYPSVGYVLDIPIQLSGTGDCDDMYRVCGKVTNTIGLSVKGIEVRAVHLGRLEGALGETFIGSALSDGKGDYCIYYDPTTLATENGPCGTAVGQINLIVSAVETVLLEDEEQLVTLTSSGLIFNAKKVETVNLTVDKPASSTGSEYTRLDEAISACLGDTENAKWESINRLNENSQYLSFVAQVLGLPESQIRAYVRAWLIAGEINARAGDVLSRSMSPEIIYGLIRLGLGDYLDKLLGLTPATIFEAIVQAISQGIISRNQEDYLYPSTDESGDSFMDDWTATAATTASTPNPEDPDAEESWQSQLLTTIFGDDTATKSSVYAAFLDHRGTFSEFCDSLYWDKSILSIDDDAARLAVVENFKFVFELYDHVDQYIPMVHALYDAKEDRGWHEVKDLSELETGYTYWNNGGMVDGWRIYITRTFSETAGQLPTYIPGKEDGERQIIYAGRLFNHFCKAFPEARFKALLGRVMTSLSTFMTAHPDFKPAEQDVDEYVASHGISISEYELQLLRVGAKIYWMEDVNGFLKAYPDFDLANSNIKQFAKKNSISETELTDTLVQHLKQLQRVYRLAPDFTSAVGLLDLGFDTSYKIVRMDEDRFVADYELNLGLTSARKIYRTAARYASEILAVLAKYQRNLNETGGGAALPDGFDLDKLYDCYLPGLFGDPEDAETKRFPNWITLFGDLNKCACKQCQTVFSAGAYMVDLLEFLEGTAKDILLERRPDLSDIELTCPNTNKVLPYIDLVNEVLESIVSSRGFPLPSTITGDDMNAATDVNSDDWETAISALVTAFKNENYFLTEKAKYKVSPCTTSAVPEWIIEEDAWRFTVKDEGAGLHVYPVPQTSSGNDSLEVYPEHLNHNAYQILNGEIFPFNLPLDLGKEEIDIFLKHKNTPKHEILEAFSTADPEVNLADESTALAYLNLSQSESDAILLKTAVPGTPDTRGYFGFQGSNAEYEIVRPDKPTETITGDWVKLLMCVPVFMHRTGLTYMEVVSLLETEFVHDTVGAHLLHIAGDGEDVRQCNYNNFQIAHLNVDSLQKISFFVRLWRKLGWSMRELDRYLVAMEGNEIPTTNIVQLAQFMRLIDTLNVPVLTALSWFGDIDIRHTEQVGQSLYDEVFLIGNPDEVEYRELKRVPYGETIDISAPEREFVPMLRAALSVTEDEFFLLKHNEVGDESVVVLTLSHLSAMYRAATFCDALGIKVAEYYGLLPNLETTPLGGNVTQVFSGVSQINLIRNSGFSSAEIDYLFRNLLLPGEPFVLTADLESAAMQRVAAAVQEIETAFPRDAAASLESLTSRLGLLMPADKAARIIEIVQGPATAADEPEDSDRQAIAQFADLYIGAFMPLWDVGAGELTDAGERLILYNTGIVAAPEDVVPGGSTLTREMDLQYRYDYVWNALTPYLIQRKRDALAVDIPAELTGLARDQADKLVNEYLSSVSTSGPAVSDWKAMLNGGWSNGSAVLERIPAAVFEETAQLIAPKDGEYVFYVELYPDGTDWPTQRRLYFDQVELPLAQVGEATAERIIVKSGVVTLKNNSAHTIRVVCAGSGTFSLKWEVNKENPVVVPQTATMTFLSDAYARLHRAAYLIQSLKLSSVELSHLQDSTLLNLDGIAAGSVTWASFTPAVETLYLNRNMSLKTGVLFELWSMITFDGDDADTDPDMSDTKVLALLEEQTGWSTADIDFIRSLFAPNPGDPLPAWDSVAFWKTLNACMRVVQKMKLPAEKIFGKLVVEPPSLAAAAALRNLFKSQYTKKSWTDAFKPLRNKLRQRQRDALTGYLCSRPIDLGGVEPYFFFDENDLYRHFLIDVEMEPDTLTSRIVLANSAIQLLVHRIFLGLENAAALNQLEKSKAQWKWMKNYRVWEANRKVFLYPENWIEPELRDDKSEFFLQLERDLFQDEMTDERAKNILSAYLEKLNEVSGLEVVGSFGENAYAAGVNQMLHVVARTRNQPRTYYYRRLRNNKYTNGQWEPWIKIDLELSADTVMPAVFNGRTFLVWPSYQSRQVPSEPKSDVNPNADSIALSGAKYCTEINVNWSEYLPKENKWSKPRVSKNAAYDYKVPAPHDREPGSETPNGTEYHMQVLQRSGSYFEVEIYRATYPAADGYGAMVPRALGQFCVWYNSDDSFQAFSDTTSYDKALSNGAFQGSALLSSAAQQTYQSINGLYGGSKLQFANCEPLLFRTPETYRICSTNFDFIEPQRFNPFFYQTQTKTLFALNNGYTGNVGINGLPKQKVAFSTFHHPLVRDIQQRYLADGPDGIMNRPTQALPVADYRYYSNYYYNYYGSLYLGYHISGDTQALGVTQRMFRSEHYPDSGSVESPLPLPTVEFGYGTPFGLYNWELFFHVPMLIANRFSQEMRFEDAMNWYHYIFDPRMDLTNYEKTKRWVDDLPPGCRYWRFLPFFSNKDATQSLADALGLDDTLSSADRRELSTLIEDWKNDPFKPHLIARHRTAAYQKFVVMKYLDNLIAWADQLFRMDSIEAINEATQFYIMAGELMGKRPEKLPPLTEEVKYTYRELQSMQLDDFSNAVVDVEDLLIGNQNYIKNSGDDALGPDTDGLLKLTVKMFYFHVPMNEKLTTYWDTIEDRLFKIRNSMNIDGIKRQLPLFQPPIDPAMLVRAAAAGIDLSSVLQQMGSPLPYYRFSVWMQKALDLCNEVKSFGGAILSALEKKDAEDLQLIRSSHEIKMLELQKSVKKYQIEEAGRAIEGLEQSKALAKERYDEYRSRQFISQTEKQHMLLMGASAALESTVESTRSVAGMLSLIPQFDFGVIAPFPRIGTTFGGQQISAVVNAAANSFGATAAMTRGLASRASTTAGYERRWEDWKLQERLAKKEMEQIDKQILAAQIRLQIAEKELDNHETQTDLAIDVKEYLEQKFTNKELYQWMITQLSRTYQDVYKLAYDVAKTAERTYQFELGVNGTEFVKFGYLDSLKKGLLAGEQLILDLKRMDLSYLEKNKRELEITKPVSLQTINPAALQILRDTGACEIAIPEVLYDLDFPGQYFRRIKAVRVTVPCVAGPNVSISAKLSLLRSAIRKDSSADPNDYAYKGIDDPRFVHDLIGIQSIATSTGQNDAGLFELNFRDERYLPFEGAGAVSLWRLELPTKDLSQFDYDSISDVILHISYTAREAGGTLKVGAEKSVRDSLNKIADLFASEVGDGSGLTRIISLKKEFPDVLYRLLTPPEGSTGSSAMLALSPNHFPYVLRNRWVMEGDVSVEAVFKSGEGDGSVTCDQATFTFTKDWIQQNFELTQTELSRETVADVVLTLTYSLS